MENKETSTMIFRMGSTHPKGYTHPLGYKKNMKKEFTIVFDTILL